MTGTATPLTDLTELSGRFAWAFKWLLEMIGYDAWRRQIGGPLLGAMTQRLWRLKVRIQVALGRWQAGTLRPPRPRPSGTHCAARNGDPSRAGAPPDRLAGLPPGDYRLLKRLLPRDFGWVKRLMPNLTPYAHAFIALVEDPQIEAMVAAAPQVGRILRPFCHTLGLPLPEWLKLPKRPRRPPAPKQRPPKPVDVTRLSSVAYGHFLHPENEKHPVGIRPPNRIGYARSRWPPKNRD